MSEQEKELLFKDLSSRFPYGVCCQTPYATRATLESICNNGHNIIDCTFVGDDNEHFIEDVKPYLRPMSSMTEEEYKEYSKLWDLQDEFPTDADIRFKTDVFDFLDAHHFDYRGLIRKGLAIEVTEENNPYEA